MAKEGKMAIGFLVKKKVPSGNGFKCPYFLGYRW
jgi:hypothetical protein